jgi:hypothetical protein
MAANYTDKDFQNQDLAKVYKGTTAGSTNGLATEATLSDVSVSIDYIDKKVSTEAKQDEQLAHEARTSLKNQNTFLNIVAFTAVDLSSLEALINNYQGQTTNKAKFQLNLSFAITAAGKYEAIVTYSNY